MAEFTVTKKIEAPPAAVFALFSDFEHCAGRIRAVKKVELLTPGPVAVGTRFRETRLVMKREATEEMELTAFDPPNSYEITSRAGGTEFRTLFRFTPEGKGTKVEAAFKSRPLTFGATLMGPLVWLMIGVMKKGIEQDIQELKKVAEKSGTLA